MSETPRRLISDHLALDAIAVILRERDWAAAGILADIAALVTATGRDLRGDGTPT